MTPPEVRRFALPLMTAIRLQKADRGAVEDEDRAVVGGVDVLVRRADGEILIVVAVEVARREGASELVVVFVRRADALLGERAEADAASCSPDVSKVTSNYPSAGFVVSTGNNSSTTAPVPYG